MQRLGVVVVGIGRAGKARVRELTQFAADDDLRDVRLLGYVSKSDQEVEGVEKFTLDAAMTNPEVNIIIVSTENERHESICRRALEAGKHVLCEFPLALTADGATALMELAKQKGVVCYEEDIALLTDQYKVLCQLVKEKGFPTASSQTLKGRPMWWLSDYARTGSPYASSINQLHMLVSQGAQLTAEAAHIRQDATGSEAWGSLRDGGGGLHKVQVTRSESVEQRASTFSFTFNDGTTVNNTNLQTYIEKKDPSKYGLFLQDFLQFLGAVRGTWSSDEWTQTTVRGLQLADQLYGLAKASPNSVLT